MSRPVTLFTGQWADLPLESSPRRPPSWGFDGLELACWGDHFDVAARARATRLRAAQRRELLERHGLGVLGDRQPPRRPGGVRPDRRAPPGHPAPASLGRRRSRGRAPARRRADEGHRAGGRAARRRRRHRVHRLADLAPALLLPAERLRRDRARLRGVRRALGADRRRLRGRGRALRARGPPHRDRLRLRRPRARRWRPSATARASASTSTRATSRTSSSTPRRSSTEFGDRIYHVHVKDSKRRLDGRSSILGGHLDFGDARARLGLRLPRPRRRRLRGDVPGAQPDRLRGAAVDRVGGLGHGPRLGRARRAGVRAPHRLRALRAWPSTRRSPRRPDVERIHDMARPAEATSRRSGSACSATRSWARRTPTRYKTLAYMTWPPPLLPRLVAIAGPQRGGGRGGRAALRVRRARHRLAGARRATTASACSTTPARTTCTPSRRSPPRRPASTCLREAARPRRRRVLRDLAARRRPPASSTCARSTTASCRPSGSRARSSRPASSARSTTSAPPTCRSGARPATRSVWRFDKSLAGSGALGDLGAHVDRPRPLPRRRDRGRVGADARPSSPGPRGRRRRRGGRRFESGAVGTIEASRFATGRKNALPLGDQRLEGLARVRPRAHQRAPGPLRGSTPGARRQGFRTVLVSEPDHPFWEHWWPQGHIIGWEHTFVHELHHLLTRDPRRQGRRAARRDVRGRLPRRRGLRRDAALRRAGRARDRGLPARGERASSYRRLAGD